MTQLMHENQKHQSGFTIAELLVVIVVIGILTVISVMSYSGVQLRAQNLRRQDDLSKVETLLESYAFSNHGAYPATTENPVANWKTIDVRTDANCFNGSMDTEWVPGFTSLPQSVPNTGSNTGVDGSPGCYLYASNGVHYVLSAWNMLSTPQVSTPHYRRLGFRSFKTPDSTQFYTCNDNVTGGKINNNYNIENDYYKHSYTISNITDCDEAEPSDA